ncbi:tyrosine-type recombinase/integrase [Brunnivagina elsteri]|uniref:Integrase n=1 Tax=Brunnivagina elsteri CCALA 953 TaxID=987040 RepID=A0A2A2TGC3_9CYAN|nr:site-specific integrase [Calothrix elsteri]PAX52857.1 integrase [Calothrix elsteri CCALA 953]
MKNNRFGQAAIISNSEYSKIRREFKSEKYKLIWDIAWYTGERWGALVQLRVDDVYQNGKPRETITFRANTRKARPDGKRETRQVPVHPSLRESLYDYIPCLASGWLFPSRDETKHIDIRLADKILRSALLRADLEHKGISTHSTRRSFITKLNENGIDVATIQKITGHRDLKALAKYIEIPVDRIKGAINSL